MSNLTPHKAKQLPTANCQLKTGADICARKHGGNAESEAAFEMAKPFMSECRMQILSELQQQEGSGKEIARRLDKSFNAISGRLTDLKKWHLIKPTGERREGSMVCRITYAGVLILTHREESAA